MKIAVSATGPTLDDAVEARFGRCPYFLIIDPDSFVVESIQNPNIALGGGAGIQSAQMMAEKGVSSVLTGNCGPNAYRTFGAAGIQVVTGVSGKVREAVEQFKKGTFPQPSGPNVESHFGMKSNASTGRGMGGGMGTGRGMGGGMGKGRGMGGGMGTGRGMGGGMGTGRGMGKSVDMTGGQGFTENPPYNPVQVSGLPDQDELTRLKETADNLRYQLDAMETRIKELDK